MQILTVDYQSKYAPQQFAESLINTGFGVIRNHPIDMDFVNQIFKDWEAFFKSDEKNQYQFNVDTQDGFFPFLSENAKDQEVKDLKEFFHFYPWGQCPDHLKPQTEKLYYDMSTLAGELLNWLEQETPEDISQHFSMPLSQMMQDSPRTLLRILHYPPLSGDEAPGSIRAAAHEDINLLTLLPAATARGLQVKDAQGNWVDVPCDPESIIINVADMLQLASYGYYKSTTHRVINPEGADRSQSRLSMPLFLHACDNVDLKDGYTATQYREDRLREIGLL